MDTVLVILCNPAAPVIDDCLLSRIGNVITERNAGEGRWRVLKNGAAYELDCTPQSGDGGDLYLSVNAARESAPVDLCIVPAIGRKKRLLIADMDSTIIEQECIDELAEFAGLRAEISEITERAMNGELDFESALRARVARLSGLSDTFLEETFRDRISLTPGARTLVQTMKKRCAVTALVSGGFTYFTERVADAAGFEHQQANTLVIRDSALTGKVASPILGMAAKEDALRRLARDNQINLKDTLAVGDGANDLAMLKAAGLGVAFRAKPRVAEAADIRIDHGDLTALLYLQGIPQSEFIE